MRFEIRYAAGVSRVDCPVEPRFCDRAFDNFAATLALVVLFCPSDVLQGRVVVPVRRALQLKADIIDLVARLVDHYRRNAPHRAGSLLYRAIEPGRFTV